MKRKFVLVICVLMSLMLLAGCGGGAASTAQNTATAGSGNQQTTQQSSVSSDSGKKVSLNFYYWDENQKPGMDKIVEEFQKANANITINSTIIPWAQYWTKLQTSLPSGNGPDIFWLNADHATEYYPAGLILDIQDKIDRDKVDLSVYPDGLKKLYTSNGKLFGIPKDYDTIGLFYNKELFDKAGVKYPDDTWTWDNAQDVAQKLTVKGGDGSIQQYGFGIYSSGQTGTFNFIIQNGGKVFNDDRTQATLNSPENNEAIQFLADLMFKYKVSPTAAEQKETSLDKLFESGKLAMLTDGSWMVPPYSQALGDKVNVAPLPKKKQQGNVLHGLSFVISSKTKYPEEAWKFLKYTATKEAGEAQAGVVIPAYKGAEELWVKNYPNLNLKCFIDSANFALPIPISVKAAAASGNAYENGMTNIFMQQTDVATGLAQTEKAMNDEIAKAK